MSAHIGSKISLISTSEVRYEGTLYQIDTNESTISLKNVRHMGTEDRKTDNKIDASSTVYSSIIFRGENIKNLRLVEEDSQDVLNDPAVLEARQRPEVSQPNHATWPQQQRGGYQDHAASGDIRTNSEVDNWNMPSSTANNRRNCRNNRGRRGGWHRRGMHRSNNDGYNNQNYAWKSNDSTHGPNYQRQGHANFSSNNRGRTGRKYPSRNRTKNAEGNIPGRGKFLEAQTKDKDDIVLNGDEQDFDFQGNLARFDMSTLRESIAQEIEADSNEPKSESQINENEKEKKEMDVTDEKIECAYNKDNFFDTLTSENEVYLKETGPELKDLNAETFGEIGSTYQCRHFRRWRGREFSRGAYNQRHFN